MAIYSECYVCDNINLVWHQCNSWNSVLIDQDKFTHVVKIFKNTLKLNLLICEKFQKVLYLKNPEQ